MNIQKIMQDLEAEGVWPERLDRLAPVKRWAKPLGFRVEFNRERRGEIDVAGRVIYFGPDATDAMIVSFADRFHTMIRDRVNAYRNGGDETGGSLAVL